MTKRKTALFNKTNSDLMEVMRCLHKDNEARKFWKLWSYFYV